jgi:hypothetical protein
MSVERRLDVALRFAVERGSRFVENEDRCVLSSARDRDALALAAESSTPRSPTTCIEPSGRSSAKAITRGAAACRIACEAPARLP